MPNLDGYEACKQIRQFYNIAMVEQPYIVAVTGNVEDSQIQKTWESLFNELVQKPATVNIIKTILQENI